MLMKGCNVEEINGSNAGAHEGAFRDWVWHVISVIDRLNYASLMECDLS